MTYTCTIIYRSNCFHNSTRKITMTLNCTLIFTVFTLYSSIILHHLILSTNYSNKRKIMTINHLLFNNLLGNVTHYYGQLCINNMPIIHTHISPPVLHTPKCVLKSYTQPTTLIYIYIYRDLDKNGPNLSEKIDPSVNSTTTYKSYLKSPQTLDYNLRKYLNWK